MRNNWQREKPSLWMDSLRAKKELSMAMEVSERKQARRPEPETGTSLCFLWWACCFQCVGVTGCAKSNS